MGRPPSSSGLLASKGVRAWARPPLGAPLVRKFFYFDCARVVEDFAGSLFAIVLNTMDGDQGAAAADAFGVELGLLFRNAMVFEEADQSARRGSGSHAADRSGNRTGR